MPHRAVLDRRLLLGLGPLALAGCASGAATGGAAPWPAFQGGLRMGPTASPIEAVLPADMTVLPAGLDVPDGASELLGRWRGWAGRNRVHSVALVVAEITVTGAAGTFAMASAGQPSRSWPVQFRHLSRAEMSGAFDANTVRIRHRPYRDLDVLIQYPAGNWVSGIMSLDQPAFQRERRR